MLFRHFNRVMTQLRKRREFAEARRLQNLRASSVAVNLVLSGGLRRHA